MIRVRDLRALGTFPIEALKREVGPFALVQSPPAPVMQQMARTMSGARTVMMSTRDRMVDQVIRATLAFDAMTVLTPRMEKPSSEYLLGRAPGCDMIVHDPSVSGRHAKLKFDPATRACTIQDVGSTNGTFVNATDTQRRETSLTDGDTLCLGDAAFLFVTVESLYAALQSQAG